MTKYFILLLVCLIHAGPCKDSLYVTLKAKDLDSLSDREYQYLSDYNKLCREYGISQEKELNDSLVSSQVSRRVSSGIFMGILCNVLLAIIILASTGVINTE